MQGGQAGEHGPALQVAPPTLDVILAAWLLKPDLLDTSMHELQQAQGAGSTAKARGARYC